NIAGGVFNFARVEIPEGVTVRGTGTRPMTWLVTGDFIVNGTLTVDGGDGARVDTLNSANFPAPGGVGRCGGGNGGRGSPSATQRDLVGEAGYGPKQKPGEGGFPGQLSCLAGCNRGSAGGGGSFSTQGDPYYPPPTGTTNRPFIAGGEGGAGCVSTNPTLAGGAPGPRAFTDTRNDNDFWGSGVNVFRSIRVRGELLTTRGGSGGGGGGDRSTSGCSVTDPSFINDPKGGGGGAGGGVIIVKCLGTIRIGPRGLISSNGGNGGGGEQAGGNTDGGCGGAGSGGMVVLMAGQGLEIFAHGSGAGFPLTGNTTYRETNYSFAISADGGSGTQGEFAGNRIDSKYPPQVFPVRPIGGFGGMGLIQIHVPPGDDQADATGNRLDDNIHFVYLDGAGLKQDVPPARKVQLLAWRGWVEPNGTRFNDVGATITLSEGEGDIRPSPILLPSPFAPTSRGRSRWLDLGAAVRDRRDNAPGPNVARVVVAAAGTEPRPDFGDPTLGYAGTTTSAANAGYAAFDNQGKLTFPSIVIGATNTFALANLSTSATLDGAPAYLAELAAGVDLGAIADRYAGYRLSFVNAGGTALADFRILSHNQRFVFLAPDSAAPTGAVSCQILAKFFDVSTDGSPGLGPTYAIDAQGNQAPVANVRIGFAFTTDPRTGFGPTRWPNGTNPADERYEFDLRNPAFLTWLQTNRPKFVQWDVIFNTTYHPSNPGNSSGQSLSPTTPRPAVEFLGLPYRF
ncbi:MAG: hypothetical protein HZB39_19845, partial [Planctomycetes bacterium]|nr:hypothetical protein [Planctomycetota bacterium]